LTTQITAAGIASATRAKNNQGPKINITSFKIGPTIQVPVINDPSTDITDAVFTGFPSQLQYAIVNDNTVEYIVTLDESVGPFDIGRIGLFMDNGDGTSTLFSITSIDAPNPDHKFPTSGGVVGNRLTYQIYLAISNMANIANFTIQLLQILTIPEVPSELSLPDPDHVAFNTYQVQKHSITRVPAIAYRETAAQGRTPSAWLMGSERLIPGQGEGIVPLGTSLFDASAVVGKVVGLDSTNQKITIGEPATNRYILGLRVSPEEITNYGVYVVPSTDPFSTTLSPMQKLYADTGANAGKITTVANQWPIGYAIGPANTPNAVGYLCWIDFTLGFGAIGTPGPPGPQGPPGPAGTGGGGTTGFSNSGQCYLSLQSGSLRLTPFNGNNLIINSTVQKIPAGGVGLTPAGLQANTLYYIYAYMNGTVMTLEASTTSHITSSFDGVEIKNLDQSRTLVGMAYTIAGPAWADDAGRLYVVSWFNPRSKSSTTCFTAFHTTSGGEFVELGQEIRNYFITFANRGVKYLTSGSCGGNGGNGVTTAMSFDNNGFERFSASQNENGSRGNTQQGPVAVVGMKSGLSETLHFGTLVGVLSNGGPGRAYWLLTIGTSSHPSNPPSDPTGGIDAPVSLTIAVEG
jgi:Phage tail-collar fibre protein